LLNVTFFGARGAAPLARERSGRYGSNTACVALEVPGRDPLLCDLGTGVGEWGRALEPGPAPRASVLLSHLHPGHVSGLSLLCGLPGPPELDVYGPSAGGRRPDGAVGEVRYTSVEDEELAVGSAVVTVRSVPHDGATNGYRIEWDGVSVAYVSDHRAPAALDTVDPGVLELADGVDLLVHDAQHTAAEWETRWDSGHSTVEYALYVAREAGARCLALFHHDPGRDDEELDRIVAGARRRAERLGVDEVIAAAEGTTVSFERDGERDGP
jgi:ribonuclease BN (tRNA processing enzyme)